MEMTYTKAGDYLVPNVRLSNREMKPLGKCGQLRKAYLKEHRPILWNQLILKEALFSHLQETDETAHRRLDEMLLQMAMQAQEITARMLTRSLDE